MSAIERFHCSLLELESSNDYIVFLRKDTAYSKISLRTKLADNEVRARIAKWVTTNVTDFH